MHMDDVCNCGYCSITRLLLTGARFLVECTWGTSVFVDFRQYETAMITHVNVAGVPKISC